VAGYNGQAVVTADQVIVGAMLSQHPVDRTLLHPLLDTCRRQLARAGIGPKLRTVLADAGYVSEENFARAGQDKLRLLAPLAKDPGKRRTRTPQRALHLDRLPATARGRRRLLHPRGRDDYKLRAQTVEPVFGQLKTCQKLTMMSRRSLAACESEWLLACTATICGSCTGTASRNDDQRPVPSGQDLRSPETTTRIPCRIQDPRCGPLQQGLYATGWVMHTHWEPERPVPPRSGSNPGTPAVDRYAVIGAGERSGAR